MVGDSGSLSGVLADEVEVVVVGDHTLADQSARLGVGWSSFSLPKEPLVGSDVDHYEAEVDLSISIDS